MAMLLKWVGGIWAALGLGNIVLMPWTTAGQGLLTAGLMFNILLYVLPGAVVYGIGAALSGRQSPAAPKASVEVRLRELAALKDKGLISPEEFEVRKSGILNEV